MLYGVGWQLSSWDGKSEHIVELSLEEKKDLEAFFEAERAADRVVTWCVRLIEIQDLGNLKYAYKEDLREERAYGSG